MMFHSSSHLYFPLNIPYSALGSRPSSGRPRVQWTPLSSKASTVSSSQKSVEVSRAQGGSLGEMLRKMLCFFSMGKKKNSGSWANFLAEKDGTCAAFPVMFGCKLGCISSEHIRDIAIKRYRIHPPGPKIKVIVGVNALQVCPYPLSIVW